MNITLLGQGFEAVSEHSVGKKSRCAFYNKNQIKNVKI